MQGLPGLSEQSGRTCLPRKSRKDDQPSVNKNQALLLYGLVALVVCAVFGAALASFWVQSPADIAARTAPPSPSPILVPVEERVLSSNVVARGTARYGMPQTISIVPSALKAKPGLITQVPLRNAELDEGSVVLTASGRPVFVYRGKVPAYRDLTPGLLGDDVRQLEEALSRLGYKPGPVDGSFDSQTSSAVAQWYEASGFEPFGPTLEQSAQLRALEREWGSAEKTRISTAAAAQNAPLAIRAARAKSEHAKRQAAADIAAAISERAMIVADPRQPASARQAADLKLELAREAAKATQLASDVAVQEAVDSEATLLREANLAANRADQLRAELESARRHIGIQVPADELVFLPQLPVRVEEVKAAVGQELREPVLSVTSKQLVIDSALALEAAPLVKPGMPVQIDEPALGVSAKGLVSLVDPTPGTRGVDGYHIYFQVRVTESESPLEGFSLRLKIPIESTRGSVTVVPLSALSLSADGTSRIQVQREGALEYIVVEPGLSADGFVEVTPLEGRLEAGQLVVVGYENLGGQGTP